MKKEIVLGVSASIAIYKACDILRRLKDKGWAVTVVQTPDSTELIRPVVFESLSGNKVYHEMFATPSSWEIGHICLAEKASLVLIAPATANIIAKIAGGICDDLLTCVVLATKAPVVICPAMNEGMYLNKITQQNIEKLKKLNYIFVGPRRGKLACAKEGLGCLAETEEIVKAAKKILAT